MKYEYFRSSNSLIPNSRNTINKFLISDLVYGWKNYNKKLKVRRVNKLSIQHNQKMSNNNYTRFCPLQMKQKCFKTNHVIVSEEKSITV